MLPCVDVFVADEFCVWATILRKCLPLRCGTQLADVRTCLPLRTCLAFALWMCVGVPNLRTCGRALHLHCGRTLGLPTCRIALHCIGAPNLRMCLALCWAAQLADVSCVAFGCPSCGCALRCVGAPYLCEAVLKSLPPSQNLFLSILHIVF